MKAVWWPWCIAPSFLFLADLTEPPAWSEEESVKATHLKLTTKMKELVVQKGASEEALAS